MTTFWLSLIGYWKPSVNLFYRVCWLVRGYAAMVLWQVGWAGAMLLIGLCRVAMTLPVP